MDRFTLLRVRAQLFLASAEGWLRNLFLTPAQRAEHYRQAVNEEAFETWMDNGPHFAEVIAQRIDAAGARGEHDTVRFWQDVLVSAHDFDSFPENRRKRDEMTITA